MRAADTKVRNAELWELRCKELEGANATLVARMRAIEEQTGVCGCFALLSFHYPLLYISWGFGVNLSLTALAEGYH